MSWRIFVTCWSFRNGPSETDLKKTEAGGVEKLGHREASHGVPQIFHDPNSWMVSGKSQSKIDDFWGYPHDFGNLQMEKPDCEILRCCNWCFFGIPQDVPEMSAAQNRIMAPRLPIMVNIDMSHDSYACSLFLYIYVQKITRYILLCIYIYTEYDDRSSIDRNIFG